MRTAFLLYFLTIFQVIAAILIEHFLHLVLRHQDSLVLRQHRRTHASAHCIYFLQKKEKSIHHNHHIINTASTISLYVRIMRAYKLRKLSNHLASPLFAFQLMGHIATNLPSGQQSSFIDCSGSRTDLY